ncbi:hypothetical protein CJ030_MR6G022433 [Morella rubra]|uniref:DC1 domain-containing protein n=1 Tax=Morella rubra TaxID=262757 RepID=A0A6A1VII4_9ROSI|nr:hypothetical protein CJ030_MR6G022433 [Morella rubra]
MHPFGLTSTISISVFKRQLVERRGISSSRAATYGISSAGNDDENRRYLLHFSHPHTLHLGNCNLLEYSCIACNEKGGGSGPFYSCYPCEYHLHKSCADRMEPLPQEIEHHPFHPGHRLTLVDRPPLTRCNSCDTVRWSTEKYFHCDQCHIYMCTICFPLKQRIKYKSHPHFLRFVESLPSSIIICDASDSICKSLSYLEELRSTQGYGFQCVECNFKIHLLCGPLPCTIKHESHVECLTFEDSIVEDDDPNDEYYCNTCEELRDPRLCVYYCSKCKFVAHVHCVMSEVLSILKGEHGVVDMRTVGTRMTIENIRQSAENIAEKGENKGPSVREMINSLNEDEKEELASCCFQPLRWNIGKIVVTSIFEDQKDGSNEEDFKVLMNRLEWSIADPTKQWKFEEYEQESVNVEGYMLPPELAPILTDIFAKYGDVSRESKLKHKVVKSILLSCLCWTVNKMCKTLVVEISEDLLTLWWCNLKGMQTAGFKVEFIVDRLNKVTHSYFVIEARKQESGMSEELEAISKEVEAMSREVEARARKLKALQQKVRSYNMHPVMKWTFAGEGLL